MTMPLAATITADLRSRAAFLPYCPLCSFVAVHGSPDILRGPSHREHRGAHKLDGCCLLSETDEQFDSAADAAAWWRRKRLEPVRDIATDRRRLNTIRKLALRNLEPIE